MKRRSLLILSAVALLFASCGNKGGKSGLLVPKDAAMVVHINGSSLSSKLSWDEIRQTNWFKALHEQAETKDTLAKKILEDPASSGINTSADLVFYMKTHGKGSLMIFEGSLTDAAAFENLCKKMHEDADVKKEGDFSYMNIKDDGAVVWNKSQFAYAGNVHTPGLNDIMEKGNPSYRPDGFLPDSLKIFAIEALTLKNDDNLDKDDRFTSLVKDGSDVHFWLNLGQFYTGAGMGGAMLSMMKLNTLLEDNITAMSLSFDNGRITGKSKHYYGKEMSKIQANNKPEPVSADVINRIPSSNVVAVLAYNYSPKGLKEILKMTGLDAMADMFLSRVDFSIDDFVKANKGELLLAVSDATSVNKQDTPDFKNRSTAIDHKSSFDMKVLFATSVKDKAAFEKMVTLAWDMSKQFRKNDSDSGKPGINYKLQDNWFAVSNSAEYRDKFLAGGNSKLPFTDKITGHPVGLYIDLQKITGSLHSAFGDADTSNKKSSANAQNIWQDIVAKGGDYKNKATEFEFEINLIDKNTNSLKQLNQYLDKISNMKKERREAWKMKEVIIENTKDPKPAPSKTRKRK